MQEFAGVGREGSLVSKILKSAQMRSMGAHCDRSECRCTVTFIRTASTKDRTDKE